MMDEDVDADEFLDEVRERKARQSRPTLKLEGDSLEEALAEIASLPNSEIARGYYKESALRGHRRAATETAVSLWRAILPIAVPAFQRSKEWCSFVSEHRAGPDGVVSYDEWNMFIEFASFIAEDFSNHNATEAWPSLIDEFVEVMRVKTNYVGLRNQGATCYLNSLLQTLFMTPEFRAALFSWRYGGGRKPETCLPLQLQRLFAYMQLAKGGCISTSSLTKAFGWNSSESFRQHDVLELHQVLADALECVATGDSGMPLTGLFAGRVQDFVRCLVCGQERSQETPFINISLDVQGVGSLQEALKRYVLPETLEGGNAVRCSKCQAGTRSLKGIRIAALPKLLFLHLARFTFNRSTRQRVKINTVFRFPLILDASEFSSASSAQPDSSRSAKQLSEMLDAQAQSMETLIAQHFQLAEEAQNKELEAYHRGIVASLQVELDSISSKMTGEKGAPVLYELYSVMVHSGSAHGGHYYAIAKSFERGGKWFNFNDSYVTEISLSSIYKTFGYESESRSSYGANAYMLAYRRMEPGNVAAIGDNAIPRYIADEFQGGASGTGAKDIGYVPYAVKGGEGDDDEFGGGDEVVDMAACDFELGDDDSGDDVALETKKGTSKGPLLEVNLFLMPALDTPRESIHVAPTDSFESFYSLALVTLNVDCQLCDTRMRAMTQHRVAADALLPGSTGTIQQVLGKSFEVGVTTSINILVEVKSETTGFSGPTERLVRVNIQQPSDPEAPVFPCGARFVWMPLGSRVPDLQRKLSEVWNKLWRTQGKQPSPDQVKVEQLGAQKAPVAPTTELFHRGDDGAASCLISCSADFIPTFFAHHSEPVLKIQKHGNT